MMVIKGFLYRGSRLHIASMVTSYFNVLLCSICLIIILTWSEVKDVVDDQIMDDENFH